MRYPFLPTPRATRDSASFRKHRGWAPGCVTSDHGAPERERGPNCRGFVVRPEIATLVQLLARAVYERWKAGEPVPGTPSPPPQKQQDPVSEARNVADRPARGSSGGAFGCKLAQNVANGSGGPIWDLFSSAPNKDCAALTSSRWGSSRRPAAARNPGSAPDVTATEDRKEHKETLPIPAGQI